MFTTVAAVSTPPGKGGIAVIRISGADAVTVADRVFIPNGAALSERHPREAVFGKIVSGGTVIDTGIATVFRAPASFTGEDTVEISCHGGISVTKAVLTAVLAAGASPAGPGDFTRRAFVNGKLTLTEAEAVGLLIDADTESRRALASGAINGNITRETRAIADSITDTLSALYAAIDYPDEDVGDEGERQILSVLTEAHRRLTKLCASYKTGRAVAVGIPTVIAGVPNSGKSSLYNALVGSDDAIVTDIPGTTRDVLTATVDIGGATLLLADTAGIHETTDAVEEIGVQRARQKLSDAALVLLVADGSAPLSPECRALIESLPDGAAVIAAVNKSDKGSALTADDLALLQSRAAAAVPISARSGDGLDQLKAEIRTAVGADGVNFSTEAILWDARQEATLSRAAEMLAEAIGALTAGDPPDAVCTLCESAVADIAGVDGRAVDEAIVAGIFARFCVGK
ncbi:MAG: tRNA uridine-5-carboxymethylaminomethyl(34) synthesis GTPase MnmE [Clostridia bacterium]|nr:tRNA uridine-5-carboxymethylaminomethyl(34) synthesis GTPase MnmE [Clostridia bacterium]